MTKYRVLADYTSFRELFVEVDEGNDPLVPENWRDKGWEEKELGLVLREVLSAEAKS